MNLRRRSPLLVAPALALAVVACVDLPDRHPDRTGTGDADAATDASGDDDAPSTLLAPAFAEYRPRPFLWFRTFYLEDDGRHCATVMEDRPTAEGAAPSWVLARFDTTTLDVATGAAIDPATTALEAFPSAVPGTLWLFGDGGARLRAVDLAELTVGPALALPAHARVNQVTWSWDSSAAAIAWGERQWEGIAVLDLPPDPRDFAPADAVVTDFPLAPADNIRVQVTSGGRFLVVADAPDVPQDPGCTFLCIPEIDPSRGRFRVFDLAAEDPSAPVLSDAGSYDETFRVSTLGRWLFRDGPTSVVATDLLDPLHPTRDLPCAEAGAMLLFDDDTALCAGPTAGGWSVTRLDADLEASRAAQVREPTATILASPDRSRVLVGDEVVDLATDPPTISAVTWPALAPSTNRFGDGPWVWALTPLEHQDLARMRWADLQVETLPIDGANVLQLEALADDGVALVRFPDLDAVAIHRADGVLRGVLQRRAIAAE